MWNEKEFQQSAALETTTEYAGYVLLCVVWRVLRSVRQWWLWVGRVDGGVLAQRDLVPPSACLHRVIVSDIGHI